MLKCASLLLLVSSALAGTALAGGGRAPPTIQSVIDVQDNPKTGQIRVMVRSGTGRVQWQQLIDGQLSRRSDQKSWGVLNGTLWITALRGNQNWHTDNLGYRLSDGQKLWELGNVYSPITQAGGELLFEQQSEFAYPDLHKKNLYVLQAKTGLSRWLILTIPQRPNCGDINDYSYAAQEILKTWADAQFFYASHKDRCGLFTARFNWHAPETQKPLLMATQPSVKASELSIQVLPLALDDKPRVLMQAMRRGETLWQLELLGKLPDPQHGMHWGWEKDGKTIWVKTNSRSYMLDGINGRIVWEKPLGGN